MKIRWFAPVIVLGCLATVGSAKTFYVSGSRPNNTGAGTSWATAKRNIQAAVNLAKNGDTIIVGDGKYTGFSTNNKAITIKSLNGPSKTKIVASNQDFDRDEAVVNLGTFSEVYVDLYDTYGEWNAFRGWDEYRGKALHQAEKNNGKSHVYSGCATVLSGFTIEGSDWGSTAAAGGTLVGCTITSMDGSYAAAGSTLSKCSITLLYSGNGGVICGSVSDTTFGKSETELPWCSASSFSSTYTRCRFNGINIWSSGGSSFMNSLFDESSLRGDIDIARNCTFYKNVQYLWANTVENCVFADCWREEWVGDEYGEGEVVLQPIPVEANTVRNCAGTFSTSAANRGGNKPCNDPKLRNPEKGDFHLAANSPCINAGRAVNAGPSDLGGRSRICGPSIDIGAYEYSGYRVVFNPNGGSGTMAAQQFLFGESKALTANKFTRKGYGMVGWATAPAGEVVYKNRATVNNLTTYDGGTITLYARWEPISYTVEFNANGGTGSAAPMPFKYGSPRRVPSGGFSRKGYVFAGWSKTASGTVDYEPGACVQNLSSTHRETVTLYAVWNPHKYYVILDPDGGSGSPFKIKCFYGKQFGLPANTFSRKGYRFAGWTKTPNGDVFLKDKQLYRNLTSVDAATVTLYARWVRNNYVVRFNPNGGQGTMADQSFKYDVSGYLPANRFTRPGYVFGGWWRKTGTGSTTYADKQRILNLTYAHDSVVTLSAKWIPVK